VDPIRFEWDPAKAAANLRKHGVSFAEAETAFYDDYAKVLPDPVSSALRLLVVVHCFREADSVIRLISARRATRVERAQYGRGDKS